MRGTHILANQGERSGRGLTRVTGSLNQEPDQLPRAPISGPARISDPVPVAARCDREDG